MQDSPVYKLLHLTEILDGCFVPYDLPSLLYHYTSYRGLNGVVCEKNIWASNIHFLNDDSENCIALEIFDRIIENNNRALFKGEVEVTNKKSSYKNIRVASFSIKEDDLSQWRAYCPNGGYSLCMDSKLLEKSLRNVGYELLPCIYESEKHEEIIRFIIDFYEQQWEKSPESLEAMLQGLIFSIYNVAPLFKHHSFSAEGEWRCVPDVEKMFEEAPELLSFRQATDREIGIPYEKIALEAKSLNNVRISPMSSQDLAEYNLGLLFEKETYLVGESFQIKKSSIPFRRTL